MFYHPAYLDTENQATTGINVDINKCKYNRISLAFCLFVEYIYRETPLIKTTSAVHNSIVILRNL